MAWSDAARAAAALARKNRMLAVHRKARDLYRGKGRQIVEARREAGDKPGPTRWMRDSLARQIRSVRAGTSPITPGSTPSKHLVRQAAEYTAIRNSRGYR